MDVQSSTPSPVAAIDLDAADPAVLLRDRAYDQIKAAIRLGQVQPGQPLSETRLSKQLGISRTPVREALQLLAQEGLVQVIPGRAVTVAAPSLHEVMDAIHVRFLIEPETARLAAKHISDFQLQTLLDAQAGLDEAIRAGDRAAWSRADNIYHETISAACSNQLLADLAMQMRNRVSYLSIDAQGNWERLVACTAEHRHVVDAIATHDSEEAARLMRQHIEAYRESIIRRLSHR